LNLLHFKEFFVWEKTSKLNFFSRERLTKKFAYGFYRVLLETALCQISSETDGSKWSQNATLVLQFLLRSFAKSCTTIAWARFEIPARVKTDPVLNNYLTQTMENNACSGVRRIEAEMSFRFIFPTVVQIEKNCIVF